MISYIPPPFSHPSRLSPNYPRQLIIDLPSNPPRYLFFQLKTHSYLYDDTQSTIDGPDSDSEPDEIAEITPLWAVGLLLASTAVVAVCAEFLVSSIDEMVKTSGVSQAFIGLIVLPIVGNAAEVRILFLYCFVP
jgi:calcium/proton exchanger cax